PSFLGSRDVGGADGDLIVGSCLIDIKTTMKDTLERRDAQQLLAYALLDYDDCYSLDEIALYFARREALIRGPLAELLAEAAGEPVELAGARADLRSALKQPTRRVAKT